MLPAKQVQRNSEPTKTHPQCTGGLQPVAELEAIVERNTSGNRAGEELWDAAFEAIACQTAADHALIKAWYGLAADYELALYVAAPLMDLDVDFTPYFDIGRLGANNPRRARLKRRNQT